MIWLFSVINFEIIWNYIQLSDRPNMHVDCTNKESSLHELYAKTLAAISSVLLAQFLIGSTYFMSAALIDTVEAL